METLCSLNNANPTNASGSLKELALPQVSKGHNVLVGTAVSFKNLGVIAIPAFIYWNKKAASDILIQFLKKYSNIPPSAAPN